MSFLHKISPTLLTINSLQISPLESQSTLPNTMPFSFASAAAAPSNIGANWRENLKLFRKILYRIH